MTTWERWQASLPARDKDERRRYAEYDAAAAPAHAAEVPPATTIRKITRGQKRRHVA